MDNFIFLAFLLPDKQRKLVSAVKSRIYALYKLLSLFLSFCATNNNERCTLPFKSLGSVRFFMFLKSVFSAAFINTKIQ